MKKKSIVSILIASRKGGHKFPSESLSSYLRQNYKDKIETRVYNLLDFVTMANFFDKIGRLGDLKFKKLWRKGYSSLKSGEKTFHWLYKKFMITVFTNSFSKSNITKNIGKTDIIISFQPEINSVSRFIKEWFGVPFHTMVMDYSSHRGWVDYYIDFYYVSNKIVYEQLKEYGVNPEKIMISGAPTQKGIDNVLKRSVYEQRKILGLKENLPTILIMAGYLGKMVDYPAIIKSIQNVNKRVQILVVLGRNSKMYDELKKMNLKSVYLFLDIPCVHDVMRAADIIVSKPGGMVIADSLANGKPLILIDPVAGSLQEIIFAELAEKQGFAIHLKDAKDVGNVIFDLLNDKKRLKKMAERSMELGRINREAVKNISENIIKILNV